MIRRFTPYGKNLALVLEKEIWGTLGIGLETPLKISTDGQSLFITPVKKKPDKQAARRPQRRS